MSLGGCGLTGQASIAGAACKEQCLFSQSLFDDWADAERRLFRRLPDCAAAVRVQYRIKQGAHDRCMRLVGA